MDFSHDGITFLISVGFRPVYNAMDTWEQEYRPSEICVGKAIRNRIAV